MKLAKLSLAALIAIGAYSSISAEPLEDVIKNVDVSGYLRYRYTNTTGKEKTGGTKTTTPAEATHGFKSVVNFKSAIDDNFFTMIGFQYSSTDISGVNKPASAPTTQNVGATDTGSSLSVKKAILGYKVGGTTVMAGRQDVGTMFTDGLIGTGIVVSNSDIQGLTLSALAFDDLKADTDIGTSFNNSQPYTNLQINSNATGTPKTYSYQHNIFGVGASGSYDPVNFQVWAAKVKNVANLFAVEVGGDFGMASVKVQAGASALNKNLKKQIIGTSNDVMKFGNGHLVGIEAGMNIAGVDATLGFVNFGTKKDQVSLVSFHDKGGFINAGEQAPMNYSEFQGKNNFAYLTGGYTIDKVRLGADFVYGVSKTGLDMDTTTNLNKEYSHTKTKNLEMVARLEYKYSEKLNFSTFYSRLKTKESVTIDSTNVTTDTDTTSNQYRFQAKYSF